jgi:nucleoside-diphosphate-sugar epimerase
MNSSQDTLGPLDHLDFDQDVLPWERLVNKTILITGAGGFLANALFQVLAHISKAKSLHISFILSRRQHHPDILSQRDELEKKNVFLHEQSIHKPFETDRQVDLIFHASSPATPSF